MLSRRMLSVTAASASALVLSACDDLSLGRREPALDGAASVESAAAQAKRPQARPGTAGNARREATEAEADAAFGQIRSSLRRLVVAEQGFYAESGAYSEDLERLGFRPVGESRIKMLWLTRQGWAASGTHPALPGRDCVTFVGAADAAPTTLRYTRSGRQGVVVCDAQPRPRPAGGGAAPTPSPVPPPAGGGAVPTPSSVPPPVAASPAVADSASALDAVPPIVQMKVDLRNLTQAQTAYFGTQGVYSRRAEQLQIQFAWHRGVSVTLLHADRRSWSARATHIARPGKSCVVWYGSPSTRPATDVQRRVPEGAGEPACDD